MDSQTIDIDRGSEKSFGIVFAVVFLLIGIYLSWNAEKIAWWAFVTSGIFIAISYIRPSLFKWPNLMWFKLGMLLGAIVAPIVMALVYITTLVPMGLYIRLSGKDLLHLKLDKSASSYWIKRDTPMQPMDKQF